MRNFSRSAVCVIYALLLTMLAACQPQAVEPDPTSAVAYADKKINYCVHVYHISNDIQLCSQWELTDDQRTFVEKQFLYTNYLYERWAAKKGHKVPSEMKVEPFIYFVTMDLINDRSVFLRNDSHKQIAGRYIYGKGWVFVTERVFTDEGYTDFPHELAHWLNDNIGGISGNSKLDEGLASDFEEHYAKACKGCR